MNTPIPKRSFLTARITLFILIFFAGSTLLFAQPFKLYQTTDLIKVFQDGYKLPALGDTLDLFGIRGEIISGQCVMVSKKNLQNVTVETGELKEENTGTSFSAGNISWNFVGYIPLSKNSPNQPQYALSRPAPALFPDYLSDAKEMDIKKGTWQPVWLTVTIPHHTPAGIYRGKITVKSSQGEESLPVKLTVYPLTLPEEHHLNIVEWYSTRDFEKYYGIDREFSEEWFAMLKKYADNMVAHRQNTFRISMGNIRIIRSRNGKLNFDFSLYDKLADVFWSTGKMDYLETGFLTEYGEGDWYSTKILLRDFEVTDSATGEKITLPGKEVVPYLLPAFESHLRRKGWVRKTLLHIKDEPSLHNALSYREVSQYIHHFAPDLKRLDAIETAYILDDIDIAIPKLDYLGTWYDTYKKWQDQGHDLWFYTVGIYQGSLYPNKTIDVPLADSRIMHWLNYKYDVPGYLHWGWNRWKDEDLFKDPGKHIGDGWLVYPSDNGVLNSLRWEEMRNGIQDYEYFWMLEDKIRSLKDSLGSRFAWINPSQRSKEIAGRVVISLIKQNKDPEILYQAKKEVIRELLDFDVAPGIYVQTDPPENASLTERSSVAVFGWTDPGTEITVNGKKLPVSEEGLFLEQFSVSEKRNKIIVYAKSPKGEKTIVRNFNIIH